MRVLARTGNDDIATVSIIETAPERMIECVESVQPPLSREEKWVLIVSTLHGCPVGCSFCDAGNEYHGRLSAEEILFQIDHLVRRRYPDGAVPAKKFKIQFARMGEPAFNPAVLDVLEELPNRYRAPGLAPSLSTVAPHGTDRFFDRLLDDEKTGCTAAGSSSSSPSTAPTSRSGERSCRSGRGASPGWHATGRRSSGRETGRSS